MPRGKVVHFDSSGGYGFIETGAAKDDVFFHMDDISGSDVEEGESLSFEIENSEKGPRAVNISR